jgi:dTDP-4-amino-4,6-dideoxygalactose transaminase
MNLIHSEMQALVDFVRGIFGDGFIPLHRPIFEGNERQYLIGCVDSNFVSSVGAKVTEFERHISDFTGARFAIATVNGTAALHIALQLVGVGRDDEVISQALTFIATCNALSYNGAHPVFLDVDRDTMGMSPEALWRFLATYGEKRDGAVWNKASGRRIAACVPMHTFGLPCRIEEIATICDEWGIALVEDAAEALGSYVRERHTGTFGMCGTLSFNGNKIITTGGGGMIITDDEALAKRAKHITTTAKIPHPYEFVHDEVGYNYRLPNLNAALGCAQMERLPWMLEVKREIAEKYRSFFAEQRLTMAAPLAGSTANNWLNAIVVADKAERDTLLTYTNQQGVMTRPIWRLMSELAMFKHCQHDGLENSRWLEDRVVNIPSSVPNAATVTRNV